MDTSGNAAYAGSENVRVTTEANQAAIYGELSAWSPATRPSPLLNFFGYFDETDPPAGRRARRADGTKRPSYEAVEGTPELVRSEGRMRIGTPVTWRPCHQASSAYKRQRFDRRKVLPAERLPQVRASRSRSRRTRCSSRRALPPGRRRRRHKAVGGALATRTLGGGRGGGGGGEAGCCGSPGGRRRRGGADRDLPPETRLKAGYYVYAVRGSRRR